MDLFISWFTTFTFTVVSPGSNNLTTSIPGQFWGRMAHITPSRPKKMANPLAFWLSTPSILEKGPAGNLKSKAKRAVVIINHTLNNIWDIPYFDEVDTMRFSSSGVILFVYEGLWKLMTVYNPDDGTAGLCQRKELPYKARRADRSLARTIPV